MSYRKFQVYFFLSVLTVSALLTLLMFRSYLVLLAFGGVLAVLFRPVYRRLFVWFRSDTAAAFLTIIAISLTILLPAGYFLSALYSELSALIPNFRTFFDTTTVTEFLLRSLPERMHDQIPVFMNEALRLVGVVGTTLSTNLFTFFSNLIDMFFGFIVILISVYYLEKDGSKVKRELLDLSPLGDEYDELVFSRVVNAVRAVMGGVLVIGFVKGVLAGVAFLFAGVPAPLFWGAMTGMAAFVPIFGSGLVTIPAIGYLLLTGHYAAAIALTVFSVAIIGVVDNFLQPKLVESKTRIHPLLILLSILGGMQFYGFAGFILGPLTLAVTMALIDIYKKEFKVYLERVG